MVMRKTWSVAKSRAKFAAVLSAAREGEPQLIRQSGVEDVEVIKIQNRVNIDYILSGCSGHGALRWIVQEQGPVHATLYVVDSVRIMHEAQELLDLPRPRALFADCD